MPGTSTWEVYACGCGFGFGDQLFEDDYRNGGKPFTSKKQAEEFADELENTTDFSVLDIREVRPRG